MPVVHMKVTQDTKDRKGNPCLSFWDSSTELSVPFKAVSFAYSTDEFGVITDIELLSFERKTSNVS